MATATKPAKVPALKLTLGGAPATWHVIDGVGHVHPEIPSPVGGEREPSLEVARKLDKDPGCAVKLVKVSKPAAEEGRKARAIARGEGIAAARETRAQGKKATPEEAEKFSTEVAAAAGKE